MKLKRTFAAAVLASATLLGLGAAPAQSANLLCPKTCLTGGVLALGGATASVASFESRTWDFDWTAIDLTELPPISQGLHVYMHADGEVANGIFTGEGHAHIGGTTVNVVVRDTGLTVTANGDDGSDSFAMTATALGGGVAEYMSDFDHDLSEECECD